MSQIATLHFKCSDCGNEYKASISEKDFKYIIENKSKDRLVACFIGEIPPDVAWGVLMEAASAVADFYAIYKAGEGVSGWLDSGGEEPRCDECGKVITQKDITVKYN